MNLPFFLTSKFNNNETSKIIKNANWLIFDKVLRFCFGIILYSWTVRYLGPDKFGALNYAIALVGIFGILSTLGIESIIVRDIISRPSNEGKIIGSAFFLKLIGGIFSVVMSTAVALILRPDNKMVSILVLIISLGSIFQSLDVIDYWFQSKVLSKNVVLVRMFAYIISSLIKIILLIKSAPLHMFGFVMLIETSIASVSLIYIYLKNKGHLQEWAIDITLVKKIFMNGWPLMLSGLFALIYTRIDQIIIGNMIGDSKLGIYSAAVTISELWYFIPMAISTSVFPAIIYTRNNNRKQYLVRMQYLYDFMAYLGVSIALFFTVSSSMIIKLMYGPSYDEASRVLVILIWTGISTCLGIASSQYLLAENLVKISFYRTMIGMVLNILLNFLLIPKFGIEGSAFATLVSYTAATFSIGFFPESKEQFKMLLKSFNIFRIKSNLNSFLGRTVK